MDLGKIFELLNGLQRNALVCFILQLPLCYTFMYMFSDFFVQQDLINRIIFAASFDISLLTASVFHLLIVSAIISRYDIDSLIYWFTGGCIYSFSMSIMSKIEDKDTSISKAIIIYVVWILGIFISISWLRFKETKKNKKSPNNKS